ncbi:hypothetical protein [Niveibacterium microcysteis]|uniref:Uncharacterized protein n=1 Tax=Niveibacterium microcysteis TaxID=2811415 RepID=A0ABX7M7F5_9RHOO|nr:hypothetical protein [Niveibacterium microcysteis]QSI76648.1 hypothetical protein JY500_19655 [Niveibacterium microcysteis]
MSYFPVAIYRVTKRLYIEIGCPPQGDCYLPGTSAGFEFDLLAYIAAIGIWPAAIWFLGGAKVFRSLVLKLQRRPNTAAHSNDENLA